MPKIFLLCDNGVYIENVTVPDADFTDAQVLAATGTVTLYSDVALTTPVTGAASLSLTALAGQTTTPASFRAFIPASVSLTLGTTYWLKYSLTASNGTATATLGDAVPVTDSYLTPR